MILFLFKQECKIINCYSNYIYKVDNKIINFIITIIIIEIFVFMFVNLSFI